jgi:hypothetical protein
VWELTTIFRHDRDGRLAEEWVQVGNRSSPDVPAELEQRGVDLVGPPLVHPLPGAVDQPTGFCSAPAVPS